MHPCLRYSERYAQARVHRILLIFTPRKIAVHKSRNRGGWVSPPTRRGDPVLSSADLHTGIFQRVEIMSKTHDTASEMAGKELP